VNVGAATWCAADGSTVGEITSANSVIGSSAEDRVADTTILGHPGVVALASGHFVVVSSLWNNGAIADTGAVTWASDDGAVVGAVSAANSIVGGRTADYIGAEVQALANGHYIVQSPNWDSATATNAGAVTWADGNAPTLGTVVAENSLVGTQTADLVGYLAAVLDNGNYVVASPFWNDAAVQNVGAVAAHSLFVRLHDPYRRFLRFSACSGPWPDDRRLARTTWLCPSLRR
jgi:hypothetical protein